MEPLWRSRWRLPMPPPRRANGRLRKVRTRRRSVWLPVMAADRCRPACNLRLRLRQAHRARQAQRAAEEGAAVGAATADFWRPNRKQRWLRPRTRPDAEAAGFRQSRRRLSAHSPTRCDSPVGSRYRGHAVDGRKCTQRCPDREGCGTGGVQLDDQPSEQRHLRQGNPRQGHGAVHRIAGGRRKGWADGGGVQLLRAPCDRRLLRNGRAGPRRATPVSISNSNCW